MQIISLPFLHWVSRNRQTRSDLATWELSGQIMNMVEYLLENRERTDGQYESIRESLLRIDVTHLKRILSVHLRLQDYDTLRMILDGTNKLVSQVIEPRLDQIPSSWTQKIFPLNVRAMNESHFSLKIPTRSEIQKDINNLIEHYYTPEEISVILEVITLEPLISHVKNRISHMPYESQIAEYYADKEAFVKDLFLPPNL